MRLLCIEFDELSYFTKHPRPRQYLGLFVDTAKSKLLLNIR